MKLDMLIHDNRKESFEQGLSLGQTEATSRIVKQMNGKNFPVDVISEITSLSENEVKAILQS